MKRLPARDEEAFASLCSWLTLKEDPMTYIPPMRSIIPAFGLIVQQGIYHVDPPRLPAFPEYMRACVYLHVLH